MMTNKKQERVDKEIIRVRRELITIGASPTKVSFGAILASGKGSQSNDAYLSAANHGSNLLLFVDEANDDVITQISLLTGDASPAVLYPYDIKEMTYHPVNRDFVATATNVPFHRSLRAANTERQKLWEGANQINFSQKFRLLEYLGEVGEACNVLKKMKREALGAPGSRATLDDLCSELADVAICLDLTFGEACFAPAAPVEFEDDYDALMALASEKYKPAQKVQIIEQFFDGIGELAQTWISRKFNNTSLKMGFNVFLSI